MAKAFTVKYDYLSHRLTSKIILISPDDKSIQKQYIGIWDTGATQTLVTNNVVKDLNLKNLVIQLSIHQLGLVRQIRILLVCGYQMIKLLLILPWLA